MAPTVCNLAEKVTKRKPLFCAIDLHDAELLAGFAVDRGECCLTRRYKTGDGGYKELVKELSRFKEEEGVERVLVGYEASGSGFGLYDFIKEAGHECAVLPPTHLPSSRRSRAMKTDARDMLRVMDVLRSHVLAGAKLPSVWVPDKELRDDRELVRRRLDLADELTRTKNRIHGLMRRYGIKRPKEFKSLWSHKHLNWLNSLTQENGAMGAGFKEHLGSLLRAYVHQKSELERLDKALIKLSERERYVAKVRRGCEIYGVGVLTAMVVLTELGDLHRFPNRRAVASYMGLVPRSYESGEGTDRKGHIHRMGPSRVRKVLAQAMWVNYRYNAKMREWMAKYSNGQSVRKKKAAVAQMRKLGIELWHRMKAA